MSNPPSGLATPSCPSHHPSLHTSRYKAGFAATDRDWMGHVDGPGCQSPGVHVFHGHMFHIVLSAYNFNIDINTHEVFIDEILWLSCQIASAPSSRTKASAEFKRLIISDTIGQSTEAAGGVSTGPLRSALLSHAVKLGKKDILTSLGEVSAEKKNKSLCSELSVVFEQTGLKSLFCVARTNQQLIFSLFFTSVCLFLIFLDTGLYVRSSMLENRKEASPYGYLRDIRYSQCCSPLCNNLTLLLSQASWSLRLGSAIKETCKMNMAHLCPCARDRQKTGEPQRYLPLLS